MTPVLRGAFTPRTLILASNARNRKVILHPLGSGDPDKAYLPGDYQR
jgi:hypothetical protein